MLALLTEPQEMLRDTVADLSRQIGIDNPSDLATVDLDRGWHELVSMGLVGLRARDHGVPVASGVEVMVVAEQLATRLVPQPFVGVGILAAELLALPGAPADVLSAVIDGTSRGCVLLQPDLHALAGPPFEGAVAWDCTGTQFALGVDVGEGVVRRYDVESFSPVDAADHTRTVATVGVGPSTHEWLVTGEDLDRWTALALVAVCADIVGAMRGGLATVVAYVSERVQFGVPVGSFQAVQHLCADILVAIEGAASTVKYAAWAVDELDPSSALLAARTAKAYTGDVARTAGETVMQVYGGIGQTWENIAHFYLRREMVSSHVLGTATAQLRSIADTRLGTR